MIAADHINHLLYPFKTVEHQVPVPEVRRVPVPDLSAETTWVDWPTGRSFPGTHTVTHMGLLAQIEETVVRSTTGGQVFRAAYGSKPAGRIDCLAFLQRIDKQSATLARELGVDGEIGTSTVRGRLSAIAGKLGTTYNRTVAGWWAAARVLTQHDGPPLSPNTPCPREECDQWGSLRVRFDPHVALCTSCGHTWSDDSPDPVDSFGRLVVWVRWASEHLSGPRHLVPVPGYPEKLGYKWTCDECLTERKQRADRIAGRQRVKERDVRGARTPVPVAAARH